MKSWFDRLLLLLTLVIVIAVVASTWPWIQGDAMHGVWILSHMLTSGVLVIALPVIALFQVWPNLSRFHSTRPQRLGFWSLILTGTITIGTVLLCMLPLASTDQMKQLISFHTYAGFAMIPALLMLTWSVWRGSANAHRS